MSIKVCVDLRSNFGAIRDQGPRPTCMAFSASDCHSFTRGSTEELSTEYAFYRAVQRMAKGDRTRGVAFDAMSSALELDGQPVETSWTYMTGLTANDQWIIPNNIGPLFSQVSNPLVSGLPEVRRSIEAGIPVWTMMRIGESFFRLSGNSILQPAAEVTRGNHAILIVGCGEVVGSHCYLVRNSWGSGWALDGYGWIHEDYLDSRLILAATMN